MAKIKHKNDFIMTVRKPLAVSLLLTGIILIIWPFLLINNLHQYPECIASDIFATGRKSTSEVAMSFFLLHSFTASLGAFCVLVGLGNAKFQKLLHRRNFWYYLVFFLLVLFALYLSYLQLTFDLDNHNCSL